MASSPATRNSAVASPMEKKSASTPGASPESVLAQAVERLTDMLSAVYDLLARFKDDLHWIINNRDDLPPLHLARDSSAATDRDGIGPETVRCTDCEGSSPPSTGRRAAGRLDGTRARRGHRLELPGTLPRMLEALFHRAKSASATAERTGRRQTPARHVSPADALRMNDAARRFGERLPQHHI